MTSPYIGEIRMFGGNFAPAGWALCNGQLLAIDQNTALFNLIGTTYGGDGTTTFALPNLQGRIPMHQGQGPGLSPHPLGEMAGAETVTLVASQYPTHTHAVRTVSTAANQTSPAGTLWAQPPGIMPYAAPPGTVGLHSATISTTASGQQPHDNMAPFTVITFIIALNGVYPSQT